MYIMSKIIALLYIHINQLYYTHFLYLRINYNLFESPLHLIKIYNKEQFIPA